MDAPTPDFPDRESAANPEDRPDASADPFEPRKRRRWPWVVGGIVLALLLLYAGAALLLRALLDPEAVAAWVEPRAEAALNRDVEIEGVRLLFFPGPGAELRGVEVRNLPEFGDSPLMQVESVRLRVAIRPLLRRRLEVAQVRVRNPTVWLHVDEEGRRNFGRMAPEAEEPPPTEPAAMPMDVALRSVRLSGGRVEFESVPDSLALSLDELSLRASLELLRDGSWSVEAVTGAPEVWLLHPALGGTPRAFRSVGFEADASAGPELGWMEVERGLLRLEEATFSLTGRVEDLLEPVRQVALELEAGALDVARLVSFLPDEARAALPGDPLGRLDLRATVRGPLGVGVRPDLRGTVTLSGVGLQAGAGPALAEGFAGRVELHNDSVGISELRGRLLDGPFYLTAAVHTDSLFPFRAEVQATPRLDRIGLLAELPEGLEVTGRADGILAVRGRLLEAHRSEVNGTLELAGIRSVLPDLAVPVSVPSARFAFAGRRVTWDGMAVDLGEERIVTSGELNEYLAGLAPGGEGLPDLRASMTAGRLDLDRIFPPKTDDEVTYGQLAFAHLGERSLEGRSARDLAEEKGFRRPDPLPLRGELQIAVDTLLSEPFHLTDVGARIALAPDLIRVLDARGDLFGGRLRSELALGLGDGDEQPFTFRLAVEAVRAEDFLAVTSPLGRNVEGTLGLELDAAGTLDRLLLPRAEALAGDGTVRVADGRLLENPVTGLMARSLSRPALASPSFRRWAGPFRVEGSRLLFDETVLNMDAEETELRYGGEVGLNGALDLGIRLSAPAARLDSLALARGGLLGAVAGTLGVRDAPVHLGLRLRGTLTAPQLAPEAALAAGDLRRTLEEEARERREALEAEAARRLEEARDTVEAAADALRDTAEAIRDTVEARLQEERRRLQEEAEREAEERGRGLLRRILPRPDTPRPPADTVPDTIQADTVPRDTIPADTLPRY